MHKVLRTLLPNGAFEGVSPQQSRRMRAIKSTSNRSTELRFRMALVRAGLRDWIIRPALNGRPDFVIGHQLAVFVDGCFWHGCPDCAHPVKLNAAYWSAKIGKNMQRDAAVTLMLQKQGFFVLRLWEHELANDIATCALRVHEALENREEARATIS